MLSLHKELMFARFSRPRVLGGNSEKWRSLFYRVIKQFLTNINRSDPAPLPTQIATTKKGKATNSAFTPNFMP